ncbi:MAG: ribonuclease H family protein [Anaerolineae bacterium]|nr:ribonuclease H family protein [Anaerolineae bacterium]
MPKQKYYVVWVGRQPGIYITWAETQAQVNGYSDAKYKSFASQAQAEEAFQTGWEAFYGKKVALTTLPPEVIADSISVDAACDGSPGNLEYRGVETKTGVELFHKGPIYNGTNNLGEFIAIVHALSMLKKQGKANPIYSDSRTALAWVKDKRIGSKLPRNLGTNEVWSLADGALRWLEDNDYPNPLIKWDTENWGEIRADFGRK